MHHLQELKAQGAKLDPALSALPSRNLSTTTSSSRRSTVAAAGPAAAAAAADPDSLLADIAVAQQLSTDAAVLNAAVTALVTDYQAWHSNHIQALTQNQDYITRTMDSAEVKAEKAVRYVQQQTMKLKQLSGGLSKSSQLPSMLQQLAAATEALEQQLAALEQRADAVTAAAAAAGGVGGSDSVQGGPGGSSSSSSRGVGVSAGRGLGRVGSSSSGRAGSFRSWLGVGSGATSQQQQQRPGSCSQQQQQSGSGGQQQQQSGSGGQQQQQSGSDGQQQQQEQQQPSFAEEAGQGS
jgi:hypothetical protein